VHFPGIFYHQKPLWDLGKSNNPIAAIDFANKIPNPINVILILFSQIRFLLSAIINGLTMYFKSNSIISYT